MTLAAALLFGAASVAEGASVPFVIDSGKFFDYELTTTVAPADADEPREAWETPPGEGGAYVGATYDAPSHGDFENWVDDVDLGISQFSLWLAGGPSARAWGEELIGNAVDAQTPTGWTHQIYDNVLEPDFQGSGEFHQRITFNTGLDEPWHPFFISPDNDAGEFAVFLDDIQRWDGAEYVDYEPVIGDDYRFWISFDEVWMEGMTPNADWLFSEGNSEADVPNWMQGASSVLAVPSPAAAGAGAMLLGVLGLGRPSRRRRSSATPAQCCAEP